MPLNVYDVRNLFYTMRGFKATGDLHLSKGVQQRVKKMLRNFHCDTERGDSHHAYRFATPDDYPVVGFSACEVFLRGVPQSVRDMVHSAILLAGVKEESIYCNDEYFRVYAPSVLATSGAVYDAYVALLPALRKAAVDALAADPKYAAMRDEALAKVQPVLHIVLKD